jgi:hypothetical protein
VALAVLTLLPFDVLEEVRELPVPAMRAFDRGSALVRFEVARLDPALVLDGRRAHPNRQPVRELGRALVADVDRIALAGDRIFVDLVIHDDADRAPRQVVRAAGADQGEEAAGERLVEKGLLGLPGLHGTDQLAQDRRGVDHRSDALFRELLGRVFLRLHQEHGARIQGRRGTR